MSKKRRLSRVMRKTTRKRARRTKSKRLKGNDQIMTSWPPYPAYLHLLSQ